MLKIRQFKPNDMFSIIKIAHLTLPEQYNPIVFNQFYETFPEGFLIAEEHQKIIGFIAGLKTTENTAKILMLGVLEEYRRQGIGTNLLKQFLKDISILNIKQIELEVRTSNIPAIEFYKKYGFNVTDNIKKFYQNGDDAFIMKKIV